MNSLRWLLGACAACWLVISSSGCRRAEAPPPLTVDAAKAAPEVVEAFAEAPAELKEEAQAAANALDTQSDEEAFARLETMSARDELTPEQRTAVYQAWMAANLRLQAAASNGNSSAQAALSGYRARK